jgi:hypothetical protein
VQPAELLARRLTGFPLNLAKGVHELFAERRKKCAAAARASGAGGSHGLGECMVHIIEQQPRAPIAHAELTRCLGERSARVDMLEQCNFARPNGARRSKVHAQPHAKRMVLSVHARMLRSVRFDCDLNLPVHDSNRMSYERLSCGCREHTPIAHIERCAMQWTDDPGAAQSPFVQARIRMSAYIVDSEDAVSCSTQHDLTIAEVASVHAAFTQLIQRQHRPEYRFVHGLF